MINNDLISTFVIKEQKEQADIVQENNGDVDECSSELQMRQALINQLKKARLANNLTQMQIAEKMQTQKQNVSRLEKAQFDPKLGTLLKYAEAVGLSLTLDFPSKP
ncbi:helix-turn-helix transcriptional regulator [Providencia rettgeri]|uniref:Helix-turn-helix transcriptional regulator n=1 Tax=Providencia rettgeri TaxID=587 RepID=A0AB35L6I4_PRORE|nr:MULTISPECIES: helix-turn-helix transcriptional regulator [Providencia]EKT57991.1 putative DNA-binding phage-like protein [Providencia rettgeri Dmel1]MCG5379235.1 helix-turn-helix transcriptional regulator [Providencia rettgeri]MDE4732344.1 helix-turn-helix transcriptional regulator [Providencia rettgeri]MDH2303885.1 helix-turn-helix transcriptional regulator [Providencia rettgeri]WOB80484.1 helix-turn-helix transcriptional regulator [Providencia sp. PROV114]